MARTLTITRESRFVGCAVGFGIILDGKNIGSIRSGETKTLAIDDGPHSLELTASNGNKPGRAFIEMGGANVAFKAAAKMGFPYGRIDLSGTALPASERTALTRNELDDYRPGGPLRRALPDQNDRQAVQALDLRQLEEVLIASRAGTMLWVGLDRNSRPTRSLAEETGQRIGGIRTKLAVRAGSVHFERTIYSDASFSERAELGAMPQDETFDDIVAGKNVGEKCLTTGHDTVLIRDYMLTTLADKLPDAWMVGGVLYSSRP